MAFVYKERLFSKRWFIAWSFIILGALIMAFGFVLFVNPYNIVPGGIYGIGILIHYLTIGAFDFWPTGIPVGLMGLVLNIPLAIIGVKVLGPRFGVKTIVGFFLTSVFMDLLTMVIGEDDPLGLSNDLLLASIFGGVFIGVGLGLIIKSKSTPGGTAIISMIISKYTRWPLGQLIIYVDSTIVLLALLVFKDWKIPLYSWLVIFIVGKSIDMVIEGVNYEKMLLIISDKYEPIRDKIINDLNKSGTFISGEGLCSNESKKIIYTIVNRRELAMLEDYIQKIDPRASLTVIDAKEMIGDGFKSLNEKIQ